MERIFVKQRAASARWPGDAELRAPTRRPEQLVGRPVWACTTYSSSCWSRRQGLVLLHWAFKGVRGGVLFVPLFFERVVRNARTPEGTNLRVNAIHWTLSAECCSYWLSGVE